MTAYQNVFERYEKKYLLKAQQYQTLYTALQERMAMDQYGLHTICNIYYDTETRALIRASIEKPAFKEKIRLRSYGIPSEDSVVFLELKRKASHIVYKRRAPLPFCQAQRYLLEGQKPQTPPESAQILREIDWFLKQYQPRPSVFIAYDRIALYGLEDPSFRVTFDQNIRWRQTALDLSKGDWGAPLLESSGQALMEVKIAGALPFWFSRLLSRSQIYPGSFSKYGVCYQKYLSHDLSSDCIRIGGFTSA